MANSPHSPRLAIVVSHAIQYYSPWFRWMRQNTDLNFKVWYLSDFGLRVAKDEKFGAAFAWDTDLTSGYDWELVPNEAEKPDTLRFSGLKNPQLFPKLAADKPDAILLFGYNYHTHLRLIAWARRRGTPLIFRGDSHMLGRAKLPAWKQAALNLVYRQFAAFTYVGVSNREYFEAAGVPARKLFFAPHAIDASHYRADDPVTIGAAASLRESLQLPTSARVLLFAGKLIASKQPLELLKAFLSINAPNTAMVVCGDGAEKAALLAAAGNSPRVRFLPFANQSEMPVRYAMANIVALPSRGSYETWGLAVNEAMSLGIPCLVSDHVGCQRDLVTDGETGWVFAAENPDSLRNKLEQALRTPDDHMRRIRTAVTQRIAQYSYASAAIGLRSALTFALSS